MAVAAAALADEVRRLGVCGARSWEQLMYAPGQPSDQATPKLPKLLSRHTINRTAPLCAYLQASSLSWQLANDVLALLLGKECEGQDAAAALTALCTALAERLLHLLGKVDDALNDPGQKSRIQALPLLVLEVRRAAWRAWRREHDRWTAAQAIARPGGLKRSPCGPVQPLYAACRSCWPLILCGLTARRRVR